MTTDRVLKYLTADADRANSLEQHQVTVDVEHLRHALALAASAVRRAEADKANTHAGWVDPSRLADLRSGRVNGLVLCKRKGHRANTELFFREVLNEKRAEADA